MARTILFLALVALASVATASHLYAVTGQSNTASPETLSRVNIDTGVVTHLQPLNGDTRGEALVHSGKTGLLYHWSGDTGAVEFSSIDPDDFDVNSLPSSSQYRDSIASATEHVDDDDSFLVHDNAGTWYKVNIDGDVEILKEGSGSGSGGSGSGGGGSGSGMGGGGGGTGSGPDNDSYKGLEIVGDNVYACVVGENRLDRLDLDSLDVEDSSTINASGLSGGVTVTGCTGMSTDPETGIVYVVLRTSDSSSVLASITLSTGNANVVSSLTENVSTIAFSVPESVSTGSVSTGSVSTGSISTGSVSTGSISSSSSASLVTAGALTIVTLFALLF